jgi:sugar phosphate permease
MFILNLGGLTMGALLPGVFTDYLFKEPKMVGASIALTMTIAGAFMLLIISTTMRPYRMHYMQMHPSVQ